jgi:hypothetical protein
MRRLRPLLLLVPAALVVALAFGAAPAAAKQPCWRALFIDYGDGRIDKTYPVHCYREAVQHLGEDQEIYGSAAEDINRALLAAMTQMQKDGTAVTPNTNVPPSSGGSSSGGDGGDSGHDEGFFDQVAHAIGPSSADAVPLPLLILAGLALLLLAAAGASLIARHLQARRARPATAPPAPNRPR